MPEKKRARSLQHGLQRQLESCHNWDASDAKQSFVRALLDFKEIASELLIESGRDVDFSEAGTIDLLIDLEDKSARLRRSVQEYYQMYHESAILQKGIDVPVPNDGETTIPISDQQWILTSRALAASLRKRSFFEKQAIERVFEIMEEALLSSQPTTKERLHELVQHCQNLANSIQLPVHGNTDCQLLQASIDEKMHRSDPTGENEQSFDSPTGPSFCPIDLTKTQTDDMPIQDTTSTGAVEFPFPTLVDDAVSSFHGLLVTGPRGSGKTHFCHEVETLAAEKGAKVHVFNPSSRTIGELEDHVISFFRKGSEEGGNHLLVMDDFDEIIGHNLLLPTYEAGGHDNVQIRGAHAASRVLSSILAMMDVNSPASQSPPTTWLACTAKTNVNLILDRFDSLHSLKPPDEKERKKFLAHIMGLDELVVDDDGDTRQQNKLALETLVMSSAGLSYSEIAQKYRTAIMNMDADTTTMTNNNKLLAMKDALQSFVPASLMSHVVDGYVDMRVLGGRELMALSRETPDKCPLLGRDGDLAWKELEWNIVIPISRAAELNRLTHNNQQEETRRKRLCGGVLLTGDPGTGKTTLARHCGRFAAEYLASIKMIEVSCSSMIHKEVGASERAIHRMFEFAQSAMPCIVVLDDVAIVSAVRGKDTTKEGTMDRVLSTLLHEMDGVEQKQNDIQTSNTAGMAIIGITKDATKVDAALLRPGRLGSTVKMNLPDQDARRQISVRELTSMSADDGFESPSATPAVQALADLSELISEKTSGLSGASVVALLSDAKFACAQASSKAPIEAFDMVDFMRSFITNY
ncbi:metalloprotease FTSH [Seminavis robusta]|uniref:Metalloprotease FTSH n=1 Tax=Seminavis robusta TaxID=568900 RepID=A0A9N8DJS4_9STRA|nr:metalloprotease FTSH [Seminavis robusta]|eukprot:Sro182_g079290.1 metalloprotease FTSH (807) ;mRNA; f:24289-26793